MSSNRRHRVALGTLAVLTACAGRFTNGEYSNGEVRYHVGQLPASWQRLALQGNDLAFFSSNSGHSIAVNATCKDTDDPPLDVLTRHLLMGFTERTTLEQQTVSFDARAGLRSHVTARLDGVPVELMLLVMKKNGCVYDFTYLSPPGHLDDQRAAFDGLLASFHTETSP